MKKYATTAELLQSLSKDLAKKRALLVDRHPNARSSLRMMLSTLGVVAVHNAGSSAEVLRQVKAHRFDIVLSDYQLDDGRDGQQLLEELRHQHLLALSSVFIIITSERAYHNVVSVAELAPDDYLIKPFTADELYARLIRALYKKTFFAEIYDHLDNGSFGEALSACEHLLSKKDRNVFLLDTLRMQGEILNALGRHTEAQTVYERVLEQRVVPWARIGLAAALRGQKDLAEAELLGQSLIEEFPEFTSAYDFLAQVREEMGKMTEAQQILLDAAAMSPNNSTRQKMVGDMAARNNDLETAEKAYGKVLERLRGSSLRTLDDYTNLSRVMLDRDNLTGVRQLAEELRRDWRGSKQGEIAALVMEGLCAGKEGDLNRAQTQVVKALASYQSLNGDPEKAPLSAKVMLDLAHACLMVGDDASAHEIVRRVAAANHEDRMVMEQIARVFHKTGKEGQGKALVAQVGQEIVELNNRGVLAARKGDVEGSVQLLMEAAERMPNLQFLLNASKAIFTLLELKGWDPDLAKRGVYFLEMAQGKDIRNPRVISAREMYHRVARLYGIAVIPFAGGREGPDKRGS